MREFLRFLFFLLVILAVVAVGVAYYFVHFARASAPATDEGDPAAVVELEFEVRPGETTADIARNLARQGLIRSAWLFQSYARLRSMDARLEAGRYTLRSNMTMDEILEVLSRAPNAEEVVITIPEGLRLEQVVALLEREGLATAEELWAALEQPYDYAFLEDRPEGASLEGYLFPDTYRVPRAYTATQVIDFLLQTFDERMSLEMRQRAQEQGMSIYQVVTLAAIVEREAVLDAERPIIASVYLNRLEVGMPLDADPTVQYAVGEPEAWWPELYFNELGVTRLAEYDHPYNTYRHAGLPPGPICSPGLASLQAVVEPADTEYYYFVAKGDGTGEHAFARTLQEHNANVARYQP